MPLDPDRLLGLDIPEIRQAYGWRETILYALGVGCGIDPLDAAELRFVDERRLLALPTQATTLGYPGFFLRELDTGVDWTRVVHGEQGLRLHSPLAPSGDVLGRTRVVEVIDKGRETGALLRVERMLRDASDGTPIATLTQSLLCRADGGFGGASRSPARPTRAPPDRAPDVSIDLPTHPQLALIYRLSGDLNPLHADPAAARAAGFERPILHGLASFGLAGRALIRALCDGDPARLIAIEARFSAPVFPGDVVTVDVWRGEAGEADFRARVAARGVGVMTAGRALAAV